MRRIICLGGKLGAGKGTRLRKFLEGRGPEYVSLSCGDLLRKEMKEETELGKQAKSYMDAGQLAPNDVIIKMVKEFIQKTPENATIIFDGFPRNVQQVDQCSDEGIEISRFIHLIVSDEEVMKRAQCRVVCTNCGEVYTTNDYKPPIKEGVCDKCGGELQRRKDDNPEVVRKRLDIFQQESIPVVVELYKRGVDVWEVFGFGDDDWRIQNAFNIAILTAKK